MALNNNTWLFGYGSLIWRADFPFLARHPAAINGWARRFWQLSTDHRGTEASPGRVVTLVPDAESTCWGIAYQLDHTRLPQILRDLDYREKNGYKRVNVEIVSSTGITVPGITYFAAPDNPHFAPATQAEVAQQIRIAHGPSGSNREYLRELDKALRLMAQPDPHVSELVSALTQSETSP